MRKIAYELEGHQKLFFGTLTNENRFRIVNLLLEGPRTVSQISDELKTNQTTISHNLRELLKCGFVTNSEDGKFRIYSINKETIHPLLNLMNKHIKKYCRCTIHEIK